MVTLLSKSEIALDWPDLASWEQRARVVQPRSPGVHLSGVLRGILVKLGKLSPEDEADEMPLRVAMGVAWEDFVVGLEVVREDWRVEWQPGEWERDGVYGTPDGKGMVQVTLKTPKGKEVRVWRKCLEEFKCTWKSEHTRKDILKESLWVWQVAANCYAMGLEYARLHVLWVNGDYRPPSPKLMVYLMRFERRGLEEFWRNVVVRNRGLAKAERGGGEVGGEAGEEAGEEAGGG